MTDEASNLVLEQFFRNLGSCYALSHELPLKTLTNADREITIRYLSDMLERISSHERQGEKDE